MAMTLPTRVILAAALLAAAWFTGLGQRDLFQTDEGRYAEIPREMVVSGDWVTPRLNTLKYFEKPPLQYWATAVAYEAFGATNATSRLWTALTGFLCLLMTGYAGTRLFGARSAWSGVLMLMGSVYFIIMGHFNTLDMGVSCFMCGSLFAFLLAMEASEMKARRGWMYAAWGMAALATLSKGLEAVVLPGAVFLLYVLIKRDWARFRQLHFVGGLLIYLAIAAPWFLLVSLRNPDFAQFFFVHEHFERFLTTVHHRVEPWWFFIPILLFGLWCFLPQFVRALVTALRRREPPLEAGRFDHGLFLWLWCGFIFLFFSLSDSKLGSYILPIFPALALLVGRELARLKRGDAMLSALCCIALAIAALWQAPELQRHGGRIPVELYQAFLPWLMTGCGLLLLTGIAAFLCAYLHKVSAGLVLLAAGMFLATQTVSAGAQVLSPVYSQHGLALEIAPYDKPGQPFYSLNDYPQSLPFYLGRTMTIVAYQGELEFGIGREPQKWIPDLDTFAAQWR
ncbi:MAG TPA: glycosyltransferase family 39 protein, partial [Gammaproteobacteria bacterium]|nr:glycosyltransferase family 39 protein [Gammaproteobacteria bacterium]